MGEVTMDYVEIFNASLQRVSDVGGFFERFYKRFIAANPTVAKMFHGSDMDRQYKMLRDSMEEMRKFYFGNEQSPYMQALARVHSSRDVELPPYLFDIWLNCLVDTVAEIDPGFSDEVEYAWRIIMTPGISFMKKWTR